MSQDATGFRWGRRPRVEKASPSHRLAASWLLWPLAETGFCPGPIWVACDCPPSLGWGLPVRLCVHALVGGFCASGGTAGLGLSPGPHGSG